MRSPSASPRTWQVRRVNVMDDRALLERARGAFFGAPDPRYLEWMYRANPAGSAWCHVAMDGDVVVGQYAAVPVAMVAETAASFAAALDVDAFTHPSYRGQGVFVALGEAVAADAAAAGCRLSIGTPSASSHSMLVGRLGFREPFGAHWMVRPCADTVLDRVARIARRSLRAAGGASPLRIDVPPLVSPGWVDRLWARRRPETPIGIAKTETWFRWRFDDNPRHSYRFVTGARSDGSPAGVVVWRTPPARESQRPAALVVDLEATDEDRADLLHAFLHELPAEVEVVHALASRGGAVERTFLDAGFRPGERYAFIVRPRRDDADLAPLLTAGAWSVSGAYADTL